MAAKITVQSTPYLNVSKPQALDFSVAANYKPNHSRIRVLFSLGNAALGTCWRERLSFSYCNCASSNTAQIAAIEVLYNVGFRSTCISRRFPDVISIAVICSKSAFGVADRIHPLVPAVRIEPVLFNAR